MFLVALGNSCNCHATITTIVEKWVGTLEIELAFKRKAHVMRWTSTTLTQKKHDEVKFVFVDGVRRGHYTNYKSYEVCNTS